MKKLACLILALVLASAAFACGERPEVPPATTDRDESKAQKVTIYVDESNIYGTYVQGSDEKYVKKVIEDKFYADTGCNVNFDIQYHSHDTFSTVFGPVMNTGNWDAAVSYLGQAGLDELALTQDIAMDISELLDACGENIQEAVDETAFYATSFLTGEIVGIPSVNKTKIKGLLIRKDFMEQVGYTDEPGHSDELGSDPAVKPGTKKKTLKTIDDFTDMMRRMKAQIKGMVSPLLANSYDLEFAITAGACGTAGYQYKQVKRDADGKVTDVLPGWISDGYGDVLDCAYRWQKEGLWEADNMVRTDESRQQDFVNGKAAIYCIDPNILDLISISRMVKSSNASATFTVINPLDGVDAQGKGIDGSGAYAEVSRTSDCMIINKKSKNAELIVKYMNWLYSSPDNYELARFGVKDKHWIASRDGFYTYPADKMDRYLSNPPYSGVFSFVHNDEYAYRLFDNYTEEELNWIATVESAKTIKNAADGMLFSNIPSSIALNWQTAENDFYQNCATKVWDASANPADTYPTCAAAYRTQSKDYLAWVKQQFQLYEAQRSL